MLGQVDDRQGNHQRGRLQSSTERRAAELFGRTEAASLKLRSFM